jgi:hypothetical protein
MVKISNKPLEISNLKKIVVSGPYASYTTLTQTNEKLQNIIDKSAAPKGNHALFFI